MSRSNLNSLRSHACPNTLNESWASSFLFSLRCVRLTSLAGDGPRLTPATEDSLGRSGGISAGMSVGRPVNIAAERSGGSSVGTSVGGSVHTRRSVGTSVGDAVSVGGHRPGANVSWPQVAHESCHRLHIVPHGSCHARPT